MQLTGGSGPVRSVRAGGGGGGGECDVHPPCAAPPTLTEKCGADLMTLSSKGGRRGGLCPARGRKGPPGRPGNPGGRSCGRRGRVDLILSQWGRVQQWRIRGCTQGMKLS
jgi:hypothetical protein